MRFVLYVCALPIALALACSDDAPATSQDGPGGPEGAPNVDVDAGAPPANVPDAAVPTGDSGPVPHDPGTAGDGDFTQAGPYAYTADSKVQNVPHGKVTKYTQTSTVYPKIPHDYYVYVPAQYDAKKPTPFMVFMDGPTFCDAASSTGFRVPVVFDNLIAKGVMPPTIAICVSAGVLAGDPDTTKQRSFEYDAVSDKYYDFLTKEILPPVAKLYNLSTDPRHRGVGGYSSGGIAAFTLGWRHSSSFQKIYTVSASFVNLRNQGGNVYPNGLIQSSPVLPLRISLLSGTNDNDATGVTKTNVSGTPKAWAEANKLVAAQLAAKGYHYRFVFGDTKHSPPTHGTQTFPETMTWMWADYP